MKKSIQVGTLIVLSAIFSFAEKKEVTVTGVDGSGSERHILFSGKSRTRCIAAEPVQWQPSGIRPPWRNAHHGRIPRFLSNARRRQIKRLAMLMLPLKFLASQSFVNATSLSSSWG